MVSEQEKIAIPYERQAMNGDEMPKGLAFPDQILFLCLRMLYEQLRKQIIDRETAIKEKRTLLEEYRCYKFREQLEDEWVQVIKETEIARAEYRKNRTLENADKLLEAVEGVKYRKVAQ